MTLARTLALALTLALTLLEQAQAAIFGLAAPDEPELGAEAEACFAQSAPSSGASPKSSSPGRPDEKEGADALCTSYVSSVGSRPPLRRAARGSSGTTAQREGAWHGAPVATGSETLVTQPAPQPAPQPAASGSGSWVGGGSSSWISHDTGVQKKSGLSPVREEAEEEEEDDDDDERTAEAGAK